MLGELIRTMSAGFPLTFAIDTEKFSSASTIVSMLVLILKHFCKPISVPEENTRFWDGGEIKSSLAVI